MSSQAGVVPHSSGSGGATTAVAAAVNSPDQRMTVSPSMRTAACR